MNLLIQIKDKNISIMLKKNGKIVDEFSFPDEHNLTEKLLPEIDKLLKKNKLDIKDIEKTSLKSDMDDYFTTQRIAKTVVNSLNWANKMKY